MTRRHACESLVAFRMATERRNFGCLNYTSTGDEQRVPILEQNLRESAVLWLEERTFWSQLQCSGTVREISNENTLTFVYLHTQKKPTVFIPNRFVFGRCPVVILRGACIIVTGVHVVPHFIQATVRMMLVISLPATLFHILSFGAALSVIIDVFERDKIIRSQIKHMMKKPCLDYCVCRTSGRPGSYRSWNSSLS